MLENASAAGIVDLYYLDESGFCQWSDSSYSYYFRGEQKDKSRLKTGDNALAFWEFGSQ
jgi:hypothetical protein